MKKITFLSILFLSVLLLPKSGFGQCTAAAGATNATSCICPPGGGTNCDLVPDIAVAKLPLTQASNYTEYPQVCTPPCSGNDGRLRMGVSTPIIGFGPLETRGTAFYVCGTDTFNAGTVANIPTACPTTGLPPHQLINQRIYHKNGSVMSFTDRAAGSMTYHPTHGHQHVDNWGVYTLRLNNGDPNPVNWPILGSGTKLGFCLLDIGSCNGSTGYCTDTLGNTLNSTNIVNYGLGGGSYSCSNTVQGISNGYMDTYSQSLDGMWINLPPGLCNGTYYVVVQIDPYNYFVETNENNNVIAVPITLTQQGGTVPVITAGGPTTFCAGGSVTLTSTSAANYVWSTGETTQSITVTASGNYSVTVNTILTCSSNSLPVAVTVSAPTVSASASPSAVCAGGSAQLTVTHNATGTATVQTQFTSNTQVFIPDNNSTGVTSPVTVSGISPATLSSGVVVSVKLNLTHTYDGDLIVSLISPSGNQINLSSQRGGGGDNFTNTVFSMTAATAIANGAAPFTGSYIPDGSLNAFTGNANGTWQLKVADVAAVDTGRIRNWTLTINNVVSAPPTFSWTSNTGFSSTTQNPVVTPPSTTNYTVTVTSANGCTNSSTVSLVVNALPTVTANALSGCTGNAIALSGTPAGGTYSVANPYTGPGTTYTHTFTDGNGCTNTSSAATITMNALPSVTANAVSGCEGSAISLSGSPVGGSYSVANPYTGPGTTYTHTFTDGNGCTNTSSAAIITVNALPIVTANAVSGCTGTAIALLGAPAGGTYSETNPYTGPTTTYTYTYTDGNGCSNTSSAAVITVHALPTVIADNVSGCEGSAITLSGSPVGGNYSVTNPYTGPGTTYSYAYTDGNGCSNTSTAATITINALPAVSFTGLAASYIVTDPAVTLTPSPAGGIFSGNGISGNTFNPASAGAGGPFTITYAYTDGNGCSNSATAQVTVIAYNCNIPQNVNVINIGPFSALVTWANSTAAKFKIALQPLVPPGPTKTYVITGTPNVLSYQFTGLQPNVVYKAWVRAVCNGITGAISNTKTFTTSGYVNNCTVPTGLTESNILSTSAKVLWSNTITADSFQVRYAITGNQTYSYKKITGSKHSTPLVNLQPNTTYNWWVQSRCGGYGYDYSALSTFTTLSARIAPEDGFESSFIANPNPASTKADIYFTSKAEGRYAFSVFDILGKSIYTEILFAREGDNNFTLNLEKFAKGIYILKLQQGKEFSYLRLVVQ